MPQHTPRGTQLPQPDRIPRERGCVAGGAVLERSLSRRRGALRKRRQALGDPEFTVDDGTLVVAEVFGVVED